LSAIAERLDGHSFYPCFTIVRVQSRLARCLRRFRLLMVNADECQEGDLKAAILPLPGRSLHGTFLFKLNYTVHHTQSSLNPGVTVMEAQLCLNGM